MTWRSFELDPSAPHERPGDRATRLAEKYGVTVEQARQMEQQVVDAAAGEGLDFHFEIARSGARLRGCVVDAEHRPTEDRFGRRAPLFIGIVLSIYGFFIWFRLQHPWHM